VTVISNHSFHYQTAMLEPAKSFTLVPMGDRIGDGARAGWAPDGGILALRGLSLLSL
jgi:hypothetical protein